jgi:hypothetical protein
MINVILGLSLAYLNQIFFPCKHDATYLNPTVNTLSIWGSVIGFGMQKSAVISRVSKQGI